MTVSDVLRGFLVLAGLLVPAVSFAQGLRSNQGAWLFPVAGYVDSIISPFGESKARFGHRLHVGEDVGASAGTGVHAIGSGVVRYVAGLRSGQDPCRNWNGIVVIEHPDAAGQPVTAIYAHLQVPARVQVGDRVRPGQQIGQVAHIVRSGLPCFADHLHFAIRAAATGATGAYPSWLTGYLDRAQFPEKYCHPSRFIATGTC